MSLIPTPFVLVGRPVDDINDSTDRELQERLYRPENGCRDASQSALDRSDLLEPRPLRREVLDQCHIACKFGRQAGINLILSDLRTYNSKTGDG